MTLSKRDRMILAMASEGLTSKAIGVNLGIGYHTVENRLTKIYRVMGIEGEMKRTKACVKAVREGWI